MDLAHPAVLCRLGGNLLWGRSFRRNFCGVYCGCNIAGWYNLDIKDIAFRIHLAFGSLWTQRLCGHRNKCCCHFTHGNNVDGSIYFSQQLETSNIWKRNLCSDIHVRHFSYVSRWCNLAK